jgi:N-acetylneuraminic acid mutarotase
MWLPLLTYSQNYQWQQKADYGGGKISTRGDFVINGIAYLANGNKGPNTYNVKECWAYNPSSNKWSKKADLGVSANKLH